MSQVEAIRQYTQNNSHDDAIIHKTTHKIRLFIQDQIFSKKKFPIRIFPWLKITELKKEIEKARIIKNATQFNLRLFYKNIQMINGRQNVMDFSVQNDSVIVAQINDQSSFTSGIINPYKIFPTQKQQITQLIMKVIDGLQGGAKPKLTPQGTSGSYILENSRNKKVAIFKPFDEEPYTPNNPRNYIGKLGSDGIRKGILSGQNATRQVAAYILSTQNQQNTKKKNYHGVPITTYVQFYHSSFTKNVCEGGRLACSTQKQISCPNLITKHGSLQQFCQFNDVAGNFSSNLFSIQQVHKIAILDLRILNCDRNQANIGVRKLMKKSTSNSNPTVFYELIPIDHGLSFPDNFEIYDHQITWMQYSQSKKPFTTQQLQFIQSIDPLKDTNQLRDKLGFRSMCLRNFRIAEIFLKKAAKAGLTAYQIGKILYRQENWDDSQQEQQLDRKKKNDRSELQNLVIQTQNLYTTIAQNKLDLKDVGGALEEYFEKQRKSGQDSSNSNHEENQNGIQQQSQSSQDSKSSIGSQSSKESQSSILAQKKFPYDMNPILQMKNQGSPTAVQSQTSGSQELTLQSSSSFKEAQQNHISMFSEKEIVIKSPQQNSDKNQKQNKQNSKIQVQTKLSLKIKQEQNQQIKSRNRVKQQNQNLKRKRKRNVSLPHLKKRTTSYRQTKYQQRRRREGPNGVIKHHQTKKISMDEQWGQLFFHYFQDLLDTFLLQKVNSKKVKNAL